MAIVLFVGCAFPIVFVNLSPTNISLLPGDNLSVFVHTSAPTCSFDDDALPCADIEGLLGERAERLVTASRDRGQEGDLVAVGQRDVVVGDLLVDGDAQLPRHRLEARMLRGEQVLKHPEASARIEADRELFLARRLTQGAEEPDCDLHPEESTPAPRALPAARAANAAGAGPDVTGVLQTPPRAADGPSWPVKRPSNCVVV